MFYKKTVTWLTSIFDPCKKLTLAVCRKKGGGGHGVSIFKNKIFIFVCTFPTDVNLKLCKKEGLSNGPMVSVPDNAWLTRVARYRYRFDMILAYNDGNAFDHLLHLSCHTIAWFLRWLSSLASWNLVVMPQLPIRLW